MKKKKKKSSKSRTGDSGKKGSTNREDEDSDEDEVMKAIMQQRIKLFVNREAELHKNMLKMYGLIKGQCSHSLSAVLKQESDFETKNAKHDVLWLLDKLKSLTSGLDSKSNKHCNLFDALFAFITMKQGENESDVSYMKRFRVNLDTLVSAGGKHTLCSPEIFEAADKNNITKKETEAEEAKFKAIIFLKRSDPNRYGSFLTELQNNAHLDNDMYPVTESDALDLMVRRSGAFNSTLINVGGGRSRNRDTFRGGRGGRGRSYNFVQNQSDGGGQNRAPAGTVLVAGTDGRTYNVLCFRCQSWGNYADHCPNVNSGGGSQ